MLLLLLLLLLVISLPHSSPSQYLRLFHCGLNPIKGTRSGPYVCIPHQLHSSVLHSKSITNSPLFAARHSPQPSRSYPLPPSKQFSNTYHHIKPLLSPINHRFTMRPEVILFALSCATSVLALPVAEPSWIPGVGKPPKREADPEPSWIPGVGKPPKREADPEPSWIPGVGKPPKREADPEPSWIPGVGKPPKREADPEPSWIPGVGKPPKREADPEPSWIPGVGKPPKREADPEPSWIPGVGKPPKREADPEPSWIPGVGKPPRN